MGFHYTNQAEKAQHIPPSSHETGIRLLAARAIAAKMLGGHQPSIIESILTKIHLYTPLKNT